MTPPPQVPDKPALPTSPSIRVPRLPSPLAQLFKPSSPSIVLSRAAPLHFCPALSEVESTFRRPPLFSHSPIGSRCPTARDRGEGIWSSPRPLPVAGVGRGLRLTPPPLGRGRAGRRSGAERRYLGSARLRLDCSSCGGGRRGWQRLRRGTARAASEPGEEEEV